VSSDCAPVANPAVANQIKTGAIRTVKNREKRFLIDAVVIDAIAAGARFSNNRTTFRGATGTFILTCLEAEVNVVVLFFVV
jgi:hypothetical protein